MPIPETSFAHPKNLKLMLSLGVITRDTDEGDVFLIWGRLIDETEIKFIASRKSMREIIAGMTPQQRADLRDKVLGVAQFSRA